MGKEGYLLTLQRRCLDFAVNGSMNALSEQASRLLDFSQKLDINLLDSVVCCMYTGEGAQVRNVSRAHFFSSFFFLIFGVGWR